MKKNILEFISTMGEGGAESLVKDYALLLDKTKFNVFVLTVYNVKESVTIPLLRKANIPITHLIPGENFLFKIFKWTIGYFYIPWRVKKYIKKNNISCIHVHMNQLHHLRPIHNQLKDVKILYTCHNDPKKYFAGKGGKLEYNAVEYFSKSHNFVLIALHQAMADELKEEFHINEVPVIRNGIDFSKFQLSDSKESIRRKLGLPERANIVGHVGRFTNQKNHKFIIDIFKKVLEIAPNSFLLLIGSGPMKEEIESLLQEFFTEKQYRILSFRNDIPYLMKAMDVFLFPSLYEGLPVTLIEAQVSKLPCVVSDKINKEAILLDSTIEVSLDEPCEKWAESVVNAKTMNVQWNDALLNYNMHKEIKELEQLYIN